MRKTIKLLLIAGLALVGLFLLVAVVLPRFGINFITLFNRSGNN
ncbi:MAG TPA: hypothetical protein VMN57_04965 [Anaerolineales bacterium]|nr:hypothetical protein [Anaerolineales bacterium]